MRKLFIFGILIFLGFLVYAVDFTPQGDINLRDVYDIYGAPQINGTTVYSAGNNLTLGYLFSTNGTYVTLSTILAFDYYNDTNFPYTNLLNFTNGPGFYNSTDFSISDYMTQNQINSTFFNTTQILGFSYWNDTFATFNKTYADTLYSNNSGTVTSVATDDTYLTGGAITTTGTITFNTTLAGTDLTVNSSDFWDDLGTPSDINAADITDDGTYLTSIVSDTTPQLGGYLDTNTKNIGSTTDEIENIYVATDSIIYFGDGQEASITYNGTALIISG